MHEHKATRQAPHGRCRQGLSVLLCIPQALNLTRHSPLWSGVGQTRTLPTSSGVSCGELPGWVHHDDVELCQAAQLAPVIRHHICMDRYALWRHLPLARVQIVHIPQCVILTLACIALDALACVVVERCTLICAKVLGAHFQESACSLN